MHVMHTFGDFEYLCWLVHAYLVAPGNCDSMTVVVV